MTARKKARQYTKFSTEIAASIVNARRVGASLRKCVQAAGATWEGFLWWRSQGRKWNEWVDGATDIQPPIQCERYSQFAREIDEADAKFDIALHSWVAKNAAKDGRLAFDIIKRREGYKLQQERARLENLLIQSRIASLQGLGNLLADATDEELAIVENTLAKIRARKIRSADSSAEREESPDEEQSTES